MGGLTPDHKTISNFRAENEKALRLLIKKCTELCMDIGLIDGKNLFLDGSKFRANAGIGKTLDEKRSRERIARLDEQIAEAIKEAESLDSNEAGIVEFSDEIKDMEEMKGRIQASLEKMAASGKKSINLTDEECVKVKSRQGTHAGYNAQVVTDGKNGLIINSEVVGVNNDRNEFAAQIKEAEKVTGKECETACADAGYANTDNLKEIHDRGTKVIVPTEKQQSNKEIGQFDKENFKYNKENDTLTCPAGKTLWYTCDTDGGKYRSYRIRKKECLSCEHYGVCTTSKKGREVKRLRNEATKEALEKMYESKEGKEIYSRRQCIAEHPFGHMKGNLKAGSYLLRGISGAAAETSILSTCFNITRMTSIIGIPELLKILRAAR